MKSYIHVCVSVCQPFCLPYKKQIIRYFRLGLFLTSIISKWLVYKNKIKNYLWFIKGVWEYIQKTRDQVIDLESRVQKSKDNVEEIEKIMSTWSKLPLFERSQEKNETLLNLEDRKERLEKRYKQIKDVGAKLHALLKVLFLIQPLPDGVFYGFYIVLSLPAFHPSVIGHRTIILTFFWTPLHIELIL